MNKQVLICDWVFIKGKKCWTRNFVLNKSKSSGGFSFGNVWISRKKILQKLRNYAYDYETDDEIDEIGSLWNGTSYEQKSWKKQIEEEEEVYY